MKLIEVKRVPISDELRNFVLERDKYACRYCGKKVEPLHLDHVYPVAKGGETSAENLVAACLRCNVKKHTKIMFPKPIGYFEDRKTSEISIANVIFLAAGISFVASGYMNLEYLLPAKAFIFSGLATLLLTLARVATGRS